MNAIKFVKLLECGRLNLPYIKKFTGLFADVIFPGAQKNLQFSSMQYLYKIEIKILLLQIFFFLKTVFFCGFIKSGQ